MPLHQICQLTLWNFIRQDCYIVKTKYMPVGPVPLRVESCYVASAATYMSAGLVILPQTPLLFKHAYWLGVAARWVLAGPLPLKICMPADLLPLNPACLLALCFSICHTCWYGASLSAVLGGVVPHCRLCFWRGASLSAVPAGVVPHYRSCHLVWCLIISHTCWFGASLYVMPSGLVPHCMPCLLV